MGWRCVSTNSVTLELYSELCIRYFLVLQIHYKTFDTASSYYAQLIFRYMSSTKNCYALPWRTLTVGFRWHAQGYGGFDKHFRYSPCLEFYLALHTCALSAQVTIDVLTSQLGCVPPQMHVPSIFIFFRQLFIQKSALPLRVPPPWPAPTSSSIIVRTDFVKCKGHDHRLVDHHSSRPYVRYGGTKEKAMPKSLHILDYSCAYYDPCGTVHMVNSEELS